MVIQFLLEKAFSKQVSIPCMQNSFTSVLVCLNEGKHVVAYSMLNRPNYKCFRVFIYSLCQT